MLEKLVSVGLRILLFLAFTSFVFFVIDYFVDKVKHFSLSGFDPCISYAITTIGIFPALSLFLTIISTGFIAKQVIVYIRDTA